MWYYPYNGIFGEEKEHTPDTWMKLKNTTLNESRQTQKITNRMIYFI